MYHKNATMKQILKLLLVIFTLSALAQSGGCVITKTTSGTLVAGSSCTVNDNSLFFIRTTTGGLSFTIPTPSAGKYPELKIFNDSISGSVTFSIPQGVVHVGKCITVRWSGTAWETQANSGSVRLIYVPTTNGIGAIITNPTTAPSLAFFLTNIVPTTVNGVVIAGTSTPVLNVSGTVNVSGSHSGTSSGTNTGDQTSVSGSAGTLSPGRNINGVPFDGSTDITVTAAATTLTGTTLNSTVVNSSLTSVGTLTNLTVTNPITGSVTGNSATVTTNANLTGDVTSVGNATTYNNVVPTAKAGTPTAGTTGQVLTKNSNTNYDYSWTTPATNGTVTSVSVTTANGVSGSVATATTTPAITLTLGAITPTSVNSVVISGASTPTLAVTGTTTVSGSNTGDQTNISGNAATVTTNANLTGPITSVGNATSVGSQTGTGSTFVMSASPTIATPTVTTSAIIPIVNGSSSASGNLQLNSTSDATKGFIYIGTGVGYDGVNIRLGVGTQAPTNTLHVNGGTTYSGNISATDWSSNGTVNGVRWRTTPARLTNTTSTGTASAVYHSIIGGDTLFATNSTTYTESYTLRIKQPISGTNVTQGTRLSLFCDGGIGINSGSIMLNGNINFATGTRSCGTTDANIFNIKSNNTTRLSFASTGDMTASNNFILGTAGNGFYIKEGTNATMGTCTLVLGTCTVSTTKVTANSRIDLANQQLGTITVPVGYAISARSAGTSFTILSGNLTDTSVIYWKINEPAP